MGRGRLIPTTPAHIDYLAGNMKPEHVAKMTYFGMRTRGELKKSIEDCRGHTLSAVNDEEDLLFIAGVPQVPIIRSRQHIFYMSTARYNENKRIALRLTDELFRKIVWDHTSAQALVAYIPLPYSEGIRFLTRMGWTAEPPLIICGRPVRVFSFEKAA